METICYSNNKEITQSKAFTMRKDIVEKYNIPVETIKTMDDLEPYLKTIKENEPDITPNFVAGGLNSGDSRCMNRDRTIVQ